MGAVGRLSGWQRPVYPSDLPHLSVEKMLELRAGGTGIIQIPPSVIPSFSAPVAPRRTEVAEMPPEALGERLDLLAYARRIEVKHGTAKRWVHEGMPADRDCGTLHVWTRLADAWVDKHRKNSVAFRRDEAVVYFARSEKGPIKIGFSSDVKRRRREVSRGPFGRATIVATMPGDHVVEQELHRKFGISLIGGEWFSPTLELEAFILSLQAKKGSAAGPRANGGGG